MFDIFHLIPSISHLYPLKRRSKLPTYHNVSQDFHRLSLPFPRRLNRRAASNPDSTTRTRRQVRAHGPAVRERGPLRSLQRRQEQPLPSSPQSERVVRRRRRRLRDFSTCGMAGFTCSPPPRHRSSCLPTARAWVCTRCRFPYNPYFPRSEEWCGTGRRC